MGRNHPWRRRLLALGLVVAVVVASAAAWTVHRWQERGPHQASVGAAVDRFRSSSTLPGAHRTLTPAAGVYTYQGAGEEQLSFLSTTQSQGPDLPATVVVDRDGCWTFEIEYSSFHRQSWEWCERDGKLVERGGTTHQKFDFVAFQMDETSRLVCEPPFVALDPDVRAGHRTATHCRGRSETTGTDMSSDGSVRFVGRETVVVAGARLPALHYAADRVLTGDQHGHEHVEMWLSPADGLPLRNERDLTVVSPAPAPLDSVTYTERGHWQLANRLVQK